MALQHPWIPNPTSRSSHLPSLLLLLPCAQTLALCSIYDEEDTCTGVVYLFVVPVPITNMPSQIGEAAFATTLFISLFLLSREILT